MTNMPMVRDVGANYRASELITRYDDLRDRAKELNIWEQYCTEKGFSVEHNGFDCFA
jgi:hypothetical protein